MEKNRKIRPEKLVDFRELYYDAFGAGDGKHERAAEFFGVPIAECQRWHDERPHPTAHRYLQVHCKGYLPYNTNWKECRIREDGILWVPVSALPDFQLAAALCCENRDLTVSNLRSVTTGRLVSLRRAVTGDVGAQR